MENKSRRMDICANNATVTADIVFAEIQNGMCNHFEPATAIRMKCVHMMCKRVINPLYIM